jgi:hypothetical protein
MMKLSRGILAAIALAAAVPATYAVAKGVEHARWHQMSPETRARMDEGRLAMIKTALKLNPDQDKLWAPIETQLREGTKLREAKRAEFEAKRAEIEKNRAEGKKPDLSERFEKMSKAMTERATRMSAFAGAFKPFYASLSDEQKEVLRPLIRQMAPGMGGRGHGHHFAEGGERGGHGGWGGHRGGQGHHGGRMMDGERGGGGAGGPDKGQPQAPQNAPDMDEGAGEGPTPGQKL